MQLSKETETQDAGAAAKRRGKPSTSGKPLYQRMTTAVTSNGSNEEIAARADVCFLRALQTKAKQEVKQHASEAERAAAQDRARNRFLQTD